MMTLSGVMVGLMWSCLHGMSERDGQAGAMKSKDGFDVRLQPFDQYGGKVWVKVFVGQDAWVPSFKDVFFLLQALCHCEDLKYPEGRGRFFVRDFVRDCCEERSPDQSLEDRWQELEVKFKFKARG
jgi:hypothetical protein